MWNMIMIRKLGFGFIFIRMEVNLKLGFLKMMKNMGNGKFGMRVDNCLCWENM